jgi:hypothetical protein
MCPRQTLMRRPCPSPPVRANTPGVYDPIIVHRYGTAIPPTPNRSQRRKTVSPRATTLGKSCANELSGQAHHARDTSPSSAVELAAGFHRPAVRCNLLAHAKRANFPPGTLGSRLMYRVCSVAFGAYDRTSAGVLVESWRGKAAVFVSIHRTFVG